MTKLKDAARRPRPGRPAHERDEAIARRINAWVACGVTVTDVARLENLSEPTLRKHYWTELQMGHVRANAQVAQALFKAATGGDWRAAAFWLRCRGGPAWVEQHPSTSRIVEYHGMKERDARLARDAGAGTMWEGLLDAAGDEDEAAGPMQ